MTRTRVLLLAALLVAPASTAQICDDSCAYANNGYCQDGGPSSMGNSCMYGTDCTAEGTALRGRPAKYIY